MGAAKSGWEQPAAAALARDTPDQPGPLSEGRWREQPGSGSSAPRHQPDTNPETNRTPTPLGAARSREPDGREQSGAAGNRREQPGAGAAGSSWDQAQARAARSTREKPRARAARSSGEQPGAPGNSRKHQKMTDRNHPGSREQPGRRDMSEGGWRERLGAGKSHILLTQMSCAHPRTS